MRLAALMEQPVVYTFTHDSIFLGEDGPTHQPIEQLASLRALPNMVLWRPADARETVAAWNAALTRDDGPTVLALTRQDVPVLEGQGIEEMAGRGGYVLLRESRGDAPDLVLVATGSEIHIALAAARTLEGEGHSVRVVSLPSVELFSAQDAAYRAQVLPDAPPRLVIEAGVELGLASVIRPGDRFHGMDRFGASAPWRDLARAFGFTGEHIAELAREILQA